MHWHNAQSSSAIGESQSFVKTNRNSKHSLAPRSSLPIHEHKIQFSKQQPDEIARQVHAVRPPPTLQSILIEHLLSRATTINYYIL